MNSDNINNLIKAFTVTGISAMLISSIPGPQPSEDEKCRKDCMTVFKNDTSPDNKFQCFKNCTLYSALLKTKEESTKPFVNKNN